MISLWSPPASLANHQVKRMASYLPRIFIIHDIYVSFAAEEGVHPRRCEAPRPVNLWRMWKSPRLCAGVQPGEKLNLWLLLAHHPLLHKMSVLYSIVWFQVGVQHPSFTEGGVSVLSFFTRIDDIHTDVRVYFVDVSSPYSVFILSTNRCSEFPCLASLYSSSGVPPSTPPAITWLPLFL